MATVGYLVMPIKLLPLIGERRGRMLGERISLSGLSTAPRGPAVWGGGWGSPEDGMGTEQERAQGRGRRNKRPLCRAASWEEAAARAGEHFQGLRRGPCLLGSPQGSPADTARARAGFKPQICPVSPHTHPKREPRHGQ